MLYNDPTSLKSSDHASLVKTAERKINTAKRKKKKKLKIFDPLSFNGSPLPLRLINLNNRSEFKICDASKKKKMPPTFRVQKKIKMAN